MYLLGDWVWGMVARDGDGNTVATPSWKQVLAYELAIRKEAFRRVASKGTPLRVALQEAWLDPLVKERNFSTPLSFAVGASSAPRQVGPPAASQAPPAPKVNKKDKKKAKGGGKVKGVCRSTTPQGDRICYRYNNEKEKCHNGKCTFKHVCGVCFGSHPLVRHGVRI